MAESNRGMDPAVKRYFRKIVSSFVFGIIWLLTMSMAGIYYELAVISNGLKWYNVVFYIVFLLTLIWLIRYFHKSWNSASGIMSDDPPAH